MAKQKKNTEFNPVREIFCIFADLRGGEFEDDEYYEEYKKRRKEGDPYATLREHYKNQDK